MKLVQILLIIAVGVIMAIIDVTPYLESYKKINKHEKRLQNNDEKN